jgi:hypothetical protein
VWLPAKLGMGVLRGSVQTYWNKALKGFWTRNLEGTSARPHYAIEALGMLMDSADDGVGIRGVRPIAWTTEIWQLHSYRQSAACRQK